MGDSPISAAIAAESGTSVSRKRCSASWPDCLLLRLDLLVRCAHFCGNAAAAKPMQRCVHHLIVPMLLSLWQVLFHV
jgi:hypothetical protein